MRRLSLALIAGLVGATLAACSVPEKLQTVSDAQIALDKTAVAVTSVSTKGTPLLTKAQDSACAGQAIANVATDMFASSGHPDAAATSAAVATKLGEGCVWGRVP